MAAHLITTGPAPAVPGGAWLRLSAAFTAQVTELAGRDDLTVTCAPGAGRGAPGCFIPALATVELDGTHLGHPPATCDPHRPSDRERYPALWGVFVHEAAHARHSTWTTPTDTNTETDTGTARAAHEAAIALEESRIEAAHLRRRPADRRWLRAATRQLILADFTTPTPTPTVTATAPIGTASTGTATAGTATMGVVPTCTAAAGGTGPGTVAGPGGVAWVGMTPWEAGRAAALLLARVDAGVLDEDEVADLKATTTRVIGASRLSSLAALWHIAHTTADHDHATMLELGRRWCAILGADPDAPTPPPEQEGAGETEGESGGPSPLAAAITATLTAVATADAPPAPATGPTTAEQRQREHDARQQARKAARTVFTKPADDRRTTHATTISGTRPPTPAEQAAARRLARHLKAATHRERVTVTTTSATPPGRLRMRGALAADAQRAAGATPTAEPFTRTTRRHVPSPPLRVGIACDVQRRRQHRKIQSSSRRPRRRS